jgi:tRNA(Arg) A34 adenosine deaminase TadA
MHVASDPTAHAELTALRAAGKSWRPSGSTIAPSMRAVIHARCAWPRCGSQDSPCRLCLFK